MKLEKTALTFAVAATALAVWQPARAHHGFGMFDRSQDAMFTGTITSIDFVNPHAYL